jgi:hypothetical protein
MLDSKKEKIIKVDNPISINVIILYFSTHIATNKTTKGAISMLLCARYKNNRICRRKIAMSAIYFLLCQKTPIRKQLITLDSHPIG